MYWLLLIVWITIVVASIPFARKLIKKDKRFRFWIWIVYIAGTMVVFFEYMTRWLQTM